MSVNGVAGGKPATADLFAKAARDLFAGLVTSVMAVAYGLSFAALIFAPPLTPWIAYGIAATFLTSAVAAADRFGAELAALRHRRAGRRHRRDHRVAGRRRWSSG